MARVANISPLGLYQWDQTIFDLMQIPSELDKPTLIDNLLSETAELEVLYPNPVVFKNLVGVWSSKQLDIWERLYATTQYEYNPIENYNRYETGSDDSSGSTTHAGTDTHTDTTTHTGNDGRTETVTTSGKDTLDMTRRDGGTESNQEYYHAELSGTDTVTGTDKKGHWIAGFDPGTPSGDDDGLFKQTRDEDDSETGTTYGKADDGNRSSSTTFGKTETNKDETTYGKTESVSESKTYGNAVTQTGNVVHGETITNRSEVDHELHAHGNIGVTTTQKLIREQRKIELFNLYDIIIEDFKMRFCILIY